MSASMVYKSLALVDSDFNPNKGNKHKKKKESIRNLIPDNQKIIKEIKKKGRKEKVELLKAQSKLTVTEAKKNCVSKQELLEKNLKKLELIKKACLIDLEDDVSKQIIERAVTRRPVKTKRKSNKNQKTVFTEEDFKKFEAEYVDE